MNASKRVNYHRIAKKMGVPNIILTGVEKKARALYPHDDAAYSRLVVETLQALSDEHCGDWSQCAIVINNGQQGAGKLQLK